MKLTFCAACGATDTLQHHHIVPRSEGGGDDPINLVTLCTPCHHKIHSRRVNGTNPGQEENARCYERHSSRHSSSSRMV
jgi:5-methylcytosine-specific restriction endonuclease McrA